MPLDRHHITIASRIMLPAYVLLNSTFAAVFLADPQNRLGLAPSLDFARSWMPVERWGLLWFALAAMMLMSLVIRDRLTFVITLSINTGAWFSWGFFVGAAVFTQDNVTPLAGVLPWFVATASFASMMSLLAGDR